MSHGDALHPMPRAVAAQVRGRKIYVASSWRNEQQPRIVATLRAAGHEVYDFRNPEPGSKGFGWSQLQLGDWKTWTPADVRVALQHPVAQRGFGLDHAAMEWADTFVMVLPCGRSAHLELGWACGARKRTIILQTEIQEPELMYLEADAICVSIDEMLQALKPPATRDLVPLVNGRSVDLGGRWTMPT
jgi:hypothetical protein